MKQNIKNPIKLLIVALTFAFSSHAAVYKTFETKNLADVEQAVSELMQSVAPSRVLIATDLDNTLLSTTTNLGSEHWYMWQKGLIEGGTTTFPAVAKSVSEMLQVQDVLTFLQRMRPAAPGLAAFYENLKEQGVSRIVLTSRGSSTHDATVREINRNQIPLSSEQDLGLVPGAVHGFDNGVYLTTGRHKGETLKALLKTAQRKFDAVIFTDDRPHHVAGMNDAFSSEPQQLLSIRFTPVIDEIERFNRSDKQTEITQWCEFASGLNGGFPTVALNVEFNSCGK